MTVGIQYVNQVITAKMYIVYYLLITKYIAVLTIKMIDINIITVSFTHHILTY